ncbi:hypothetical protein G6F70_001246 [Rhizopus microsporus]|nr:hypothetical protein G6F71_001972 [Rhizopus microsporus]KAG1203585.1 hypothetical protein G6F70_001246 [Rhizopus microsporus]
MHIDEQYKENATVKSACHKVARKMTQSTAGKWGSPGQKCDAPFELAEQTLGWISKEWLDKLDFVIWTGDNAKHNWDKKNNKRKRKDVYGLNQRTTDLMLDTFKDIPVIPSFGNNDVFPHNQMGGPDKDGDLLDFYGTLWNHWIPHSQRSTFRQGGYFMIQVTPNIYVISLNTMYFYNKNKAVQNCNRASSPAHIQLKWLERQLSMARMKNAKIYVTGHVPPSPRDYRNSCLSQFMRIASDYTDVILGHFFAHLNMDHFLIFDGKRQEISTQRDISAYTDWLYSMYQSIDINFISPPPLVVIQVAPSILPVYYPTFRIYQYEVNQTDRLGHLLGYAQYYSNLTKWNSHDHLEYELEYTTQDAYHMPDLSVASYYNLAKAMVTNDPQQNELWSLYREHMVIKTINFTDYDDDDDDGDSIVY